MSVDTPVTPVPLSPVTSTSIDELLSSLAADVGETMGLESVTIVGDTLLPVRWGEPSGMGSEVELRHRGELVGLLHVTALSGDPLTGRDLVTLRELSSVIAAAVVIGRGAADLEDLRGRLAAVRLEERRVIRRELHDGLGPSLVGIGRGLEQARDLLATDPAAGLALLAPLQAEVEAATAMVRSLAHHLLPPVLDELGLAAALTELAHRHDSPSLRVDVIAEGLDDLEPGIAAAAYTIVSEATTTVLRHAVASWCSIGARRHGDLLVVTVSDDGRAAPGGAPAGAVSLAMRERAEEQGGTLEVRSRTGDGTEVVAVLPLGVGRG
jgi:signal transduction histidine kinase